MTDRINRTNPTNGTDEADQTDPTGRREHTEQTWQAVLGTPGTVRFLPRYDLPWDEWGGGPGFDQKYHTPRLDWTFESRNVSRSDGHMANIVVTRNETGLPWVDGWTEGDGPLDDLMALAMVDLDRPKFPLGRLVATPGALAALARTGQHAIEFQERHKTGDWGDLCDSDKRANDGALKDGTRIFSAYHLKDQTKIWVITEADRSATTLLLPADY